MARFLLVTKAFEAKMMPLILEREGHECKVYVEDATQREILKGTVDHVADWHSELEWADVIVFDDIGFGATADWLRKDGYLVWGGSSLGDKMEEDRTFGMRLFEKAGLNVPPYFAFKSFEDARKHVAEKPGRYAFKPNKNIAKEFTYCSHFDDGSDLIAILDEFEKEWPKDAEIDFLLQEYVHGVGEVGVGAFFMGNDWVRSPGGKVVCEVDQEHKPMFACGTLGGEVGMGTGEQGNVAFMLEEPRIFQESLGRLTDTLKKIGYVGEFALGFIMDDAGKLWVLECTARLGYPITWQHDTMHKTGWGELFVKSVKGVNRFLEYNKGICMSVVVTNPPFPFTKENNPYSGARILFKDGSDSTAILDKEGYYWCEVIEQDGALVTAGVSGYTVVLTAMGKSVADAQSKMKDKLCEFTIRDRGWRNDIGDKTKEFLPLLAKFKWI